MVYSARLFAIAAIFSAPVVSIATPRSQPERNVPNPEAYASSVASVDCSNVIERRSSIRPLLPVIRKATRGAGTQPAKDEFETTAAYEARRATHFRNLLGGTDKLVLDHKLDDVFYILKYDADAGIMNIGVYDEDIYHTKPSQPSDYSIQLFRDTIATDHFVGENSFGVTRDVERNDRVRAALLFPVTQLLPGMPRQYETIRIPMTPDEARRFKSDPNLLVVARLRSPYMVHSYERSRATIDYPYEYRRHSYGLKVDLECLVFASGGEEVHRLTFK